MRIAFLLPGIHDVARGAEVAFESVADAIAANGIDDVTVFGSGAPRPDRAYRYRQVGRVRRERFERMPSVPPFRSEYIYEEATWVAAALAAYRPSEFDVTVTCSFPFVHWLTRWLPAIRSTRPKHVFVTQNGDHPASRDRLEYRTFRCDGLVCTNPIYFERQRHQWPSVLIPNGIDVARFQGGAANRARFDLPADAAVVLMVSALVDTKRVLAGIQAVADVPGAFLVVAGDGPQRDEVDAAAARMLPDRFRRLSVTFDAMPDLYRSVDAFLHMATFESFGNVYVEAMAVGLPVVAHDSPATRWIMGDEPGLVDTSDLIATTRAIEAALASGGQRSSEALAEVRNRFDWRGIAEQYREFFDQVLASKGSP